MSRQRPAGCVEADKWMRSYKPVSIGTMSVAVLVEEGATLARIRIDADSGVGMFQAFEQLLSFRT